MTVPSVSRGVAWTVTGPGRLDCTDQAVAPLGAHEVLVAIEAVALNRRDLVLLDTASSMGRDACGTVPCSDAVGCIIACGGAGPYAIGERVVTRFLPQWNDGRPPSRDLVPGFGGPCPGVLATHVIAPAGHFTRAPAWLSPAEACTLPCAGLTAWTAVGGRSLEGQWVGVHGSGGVSTFALQIAIALGARVLVVTRDPTRGGPLEALGAAGVIRGSDDWPERVLEMTGGRGVDLALDMGVRGALERWVQLAAGGGTVAIVGALEGARTELDIGPCIRRNVSLRGVTAGSLTEFEAFIRFLERTALRPVVDAVVPFDETPRAFERLRGGAGIGKIVVRVA